LCASAPSAALHRGKAELALLRGGHSPYAKMLGETQPMAGRIGVAKKKMEKSWRDFVSVALQMIATGVVLSVAANLRAAPSGPQLSESVQAFYQGDYARAATGARAYLRTHPGDSRGLVLLSRAEMAQGHYEQAYQELREALRSDPKNIDALYYLGALSKILGRTAYEQLLAMAPDGARAHQFLAESFFGERNDQKASAEYKAALKADPGSVEVLCALGDLERLNMQFETAMDYYSRALRIAPNEYCGVYGMGVAHLRRHEMPKAIEYFRHAVSLSPDSGVTRLALGSALLQNGDAAEAVTELRAAVIRQPDLRQAYALLARAYRTLGKPTEAEESLKRAMALEEREHEFLNKALILDDLTPPPPVDGGPGPPNP